MIKFYQLRWKYCDKHWLLAKLISQTHSLGPLSCIDIWMAMRFYQYFWRRSFNYVVVRIFKTPKNTINTYSFPGLIQHQHQKILLFKGWADLFVLLQKKKKQASISDGNGVFSIFYLTKIMKTKPRKMRLELRVIGNRMKGDLEMPQVFFFFFKASFREAGRYRGSQTSTSRCVCTSADLLHQI